MQIILTRHGETEENKAGILQGHLPGELSEKGIEQAKKVASRLQNETIDYIYTSDLARASDTAKEIASYHPKTPLIFTEELRERNLGRLQGEVNKKYRHHLTDIDFHPKNGETIQNVYDRGYQFVKTLLDKHTKDQTILLVCHDFIGTILAGALTGKSSAEILGLYGLGNTSISIFDISPEHVCTTVVYNNTDHLR